MTNQPLNAASLRGAVDLSSLKKPQAAAPGNATPGAQGPGAPAPSSGQAQEGGTFRRDGLVVDVTTDNFQALAQQSVAHPVIVAIWARSQPASQQPIDVLARAVRKQEGRVLLGVADLDDSPEIGQVFAQLSQQAAQQGQPGQILAAAFVQGQPIPIPPVVEDAMADAILGQIVQIAVQNGVTGRVADYDPNAAGAADGGSDADVSPEPELPPLHKIAYDAID